MELNNTIKQSIKILEQNGVLEAKTNAMLLCCHVLKKSKSEVMLTKTILKLQHDRIVRLSNKRASGIPVQYITKQVDFYYNKIYVNKNVLIPRNETEQLCDIVSNELKGGAVLDLCTGSGCIGLGIKNKVKTARVTLSDVSDKALYVAKKNARANNLNVKIIKSDLFKNIKEKFDVIVSNPPYIKTKDLMELSKEVCHEPSLALDGGEGGYKFYEQIISMAPQFLNKFGKIYFECGVGQAQKIAKCLEKNFDCIKIIKDYYNKQRFVTGVIKS